MPDSLTPSNGAISLEIRPSLILTCLPKIRPWHCWYFHLIYRQGDLIMKKRYTEEHPIRAIKQNEAGTKVDDIYCDFLSDFL